MRIAFNKCVWTLAVAGALLAPLPSLASVVYQFSLAANGAVGPLVIRQTLPTFTPDGPLLVTQMSNPSITYTSGTPIVAAVSLIGFDQDPTLSRYGIDLIDANVNRVLFTVNYPADFFVFNRGVTAEGTFLSTSGTVSGTNLATTTPVATLCVSSVGACDSTRGTVPEPESTALFGLGVLALVAARRKRQTH